MIEVQTATDSMEVCDWEATGPNDLDNLDAQFEGEGERVLLNTELGTVLHPALVNAT